ncbi:DUF2683 family protein [Flavobacterium cellulosilyticum]|uniref:Uncharacterized protein n=1 Tax=Flavobacterium cellulosilyticum TaxID=2541731 RepID=A0A4R5CC34_9FLAO|nr:DUF2683 family protein [Flavobacterium cellulosilyticum]TDD96995.1 hypothetical protein E0F76_10175 [Flavobacterium cellulosilyticum]
MTTITFKIDKRTKAGKAFLAMTEAFLQNVEGIEIIENVGTCDSVNEDQSSYNPDFVAEILNRSKNLDKKKLTRLNPDDVWGSIL